MADRKITDLTALAAGSQATGDLVTIVDVSEAAAADKNKKMTMENLFKGIPGDVGIGTSSPSATLDVTNGGFCLKDTSSSFSASESISYFHNTSTQYAEIEFSPQNASTGRIFVKNRVSSALSDVVTIEGSNVGIGTTSISDDIHLKRTSADAILRIENTGNGNHSGIFFVRESSGGTSKGAANIHVESDTSGTGTALIFGCGSNTSATGGERMRIDSSGRLLVGTTSGRNVGGGANALVQVETTSQNAISFVCHRGTSTSGSILVLGKSRGTAAGSNTIVASGDELGALRFAGADGTDVESRGGEINCEVDGTPSSNDMPGRLIFKTTPNGGNSPSERMRINNTGKVLIGTTAVLETSSAAKLHIAHTSGALLALGRNDAAVTDGNDMGKIAFYGNDGGGYEKVAQIMCEADGAHASGDKPGRLIFQTTADGASNPTEHMRIDEAGMVSIHRQGATQQLRLGTIDGSTFTTNNENYMTVHGNSANDYVLIKGCNTADGTPSFEVVVGGTRSIEIECDGDIYNLSGTYGTISDARLKENIVNASSQWQDVKDLQVRNFNFTEASGLPTNTQIGFVAQEVEQVSPGLVKTNPDLDQDGNDLGTTTKAVKTSVLLVKSVKALQEAMDRIETLETKVAALEAQ